MIKVQENKGIYEIIIHANVDDKKIKSDLINITIDTKRHMYYIALPNEKRKNKQIKKISDTINNDFFSKFLLKRISKDPSNIGISGKTKTFEKNILVEIFNELGIDIAYNDSKVKDVKVHSLEMDFEKRIYKN